MNDMDTSYVVPAAMQQRIIAALRQTLDRLERSTDGALANWAAIDEARAVLAQWDDHENGVNSDAW